MKGLKSLLNFCPICENLLKIKKKPDGKVISHCQCGYSELLYIIHKRTKTTVKQYSCLFCAKKFSILNSLHQHSKDKGHSLTWILESYKKQGLSIEEMIKTENSRKLPIDVKRNFVLAYLVKIHANFTCQGCELDFKYKGDQKVEAHHKLPLSQGGKDHSDNLTVLCHRHHKEIHYNKN